MDFSKQGRTFVLRDPKQVTNLEAKMSGASINTSVLAAFNLRDLLIIQFLITARQSYSTFISCVLSGLNEKCN